VPTKPIQVSATLSAALSPPQNKLHMCSPSPFGFKRQDVCSLCPTDYCVKLLYVNSAYTLSNGKGKTDATSVHLQITSWRDLGNGRDKACPSWRKCHTCLRKGCGADETRKAGLIFGQIKEMFERGDDGTEESAIRGLRMLKLRIPRAASSEIQILYRRIICVRSWKRWSWECPQSSRGFLIGLVCPSLGCLDGSLCQSAWTLTTIQPYGRGAQISA
jgi:hypothetical protein